MQAPDGVTGCVACRVVLNGLRSVDPAQQLNALETVRIRAEEISDELEHSASGRDLLSEIAVLGRGSNGAGPSPRCADAAARALNALGKQMDRGEAPGLRTKGPSSPLTDVPGHLQGSRLWSAAFS